MKQEILRFENVTRQVDGAVYLDNFNFYMTKGEIVGMLSVNDRGKKEDSRRRDRTGREFCKRI